MDKEKVEEVKEKAKGFVTKVLDYVKAHKTVFAIAAAGVVGFILGLFF
jgi:ElaB/YqjD/DUF883 family membrane-anchored ribosome-binding protein